MMKSCLKIFKRDLSAVYLLISSKSCSNKLETGLFLPSNNPLASEIENILSISLYKSQIKKYFISPLMKLNKFFLTPFKPVSSFFLLPT